MVITPEELIKDLHPTEKIVLDSYHGGATEQEALDRTKRKNKKTGEREPFPSERQHRAYRKRLYDMGLLIRIEPKNSKIPGKWIPRTDIINPTPTIDQNDLESLEFDRKQAVEVLLAWGKSNYLMSIVQEIYDLFENYAKVNKRKVDAICLRRIAPVVREIITMRELGSDLTTPNEFFSTMRTRPHYHPGNSTKIEGPIGVLSNGEIMKKSKTQRLIEWSRIKQIDKSDIFFPTTLEWANYLLAVSKQILQNAEKKWYG